MTNKEFILTAIKTNKPEFVKLGIRTIGLFGSYLRNEQSANSDIDLLVVLNKEEIPQNFKEKLENKVLVRNMILSLSKEVPIDLLVYSRKEYELINLSDNSFARNINKFGKILS